MLPTLVSFVQSGFMKGRQSADSIFVASELVSRLKSGLSEGLIFKVYFEKAFDPIDWNFLLFLLYFFNFDAKWVNWLSVILETTRIFSAC